MGRMMGRSTVQFEVLDLPAGPDVQQNNWDFSDKRLRFPCASRLHSTAVQILTLVPYVNAFFNTFPISAKAAFVVGKPKADRSQRSIHRPTAIPQIVLPEAETPRQSTRCDGLIR
jgi:hypothetical protein